MEAIQDDLKDSALPYVLVYSGGEICPVHDEKGAAVNQYHNYYFFTCFLGITPPPPPPPTGILGYVRFAVGPLAPVNQVWNNFCFSFIVKCGKKR
jgi:hypothetical protein